jgi:hypothetical protein
MEGRVESRGVNPHGFKQITIANWKRRDPILRSFVKIEPDGKQVPVSGDEWASALLSISLTDQVPEPLQALFKVACGALIYGYFFYPLYALGLEQVYRAADAALAYKCGTMDLPNRLTFSERIAWLTDRKVLSSKDSDDWDNIRKFRNIASHPERPMILPPGDAITLVRWVSKQINHLFVV